LKAVAAHSFLALVILLVIVCLFGNQFIQLSVYSSSLSFVAVNITLPLPPAHRSWHNQRRHSEKGLIKSKHADSGRSEDWERATIGFDSQMRISAGALWLWPWTMRMGGANYTLEFSLQPGSGGEKMHVDEKDGQSARTRYRIVERAGNATAWVELQPYTGRTHQLRVHMAAIGHPIVGDGKYGGKDAFLTGTISRKMHLHARRIRIDHPAGHHDFGRHGRRHARAAREARLHGPATQPGSH
jgi:hypothetical protein